MLALVGTGLLVAPILHTCDAGVPSPHRADVGLAAFLGDPPDGLDAGCAACVLSSHTRTAFTAIDAVVLPPAPDGLVQACTAVAWTDERFRVLSARSPPRSV